MEIGSVRVRGPLVLAAMEEHTTLPFRLIAKELGAHLVFTEMVQPDRLVKRERLAHRLLATEPRERPVGGQVLAADEKDTAEAARIIAGKGFDLVDVNASCPIQRVVSRGWGGAYLSEPSRLEALIGRCVEAARPTPVTVKMRSGPRDEVRNAPEIAARLEAVGCSAVLVHARSVERAYRGGADWTVLKETKAAVSRIPVIGAGDVRTPEDAVRLLSETGCDGVLLARGALGNPWIISRTARLIAGERAPPPSREERLRVCVRHLEAEARFLNEKKPTPRLLRMCFYYAKDLPDFAAIQERAREARTIPELVRALKEAFRGR